MVGKARRNARREFGRRGKGHETFGRDLPSRGKGGGGCDGILRSVKADKAAPFVEIENDLLSPPDRICIQYKNNAEMENNRPRNALVRVARFYIDGFRQMTWGRTLWILILVKLFIMFVVLRMIFFPRFLNQFSTQDERRQYVSEELIDRAAP